ncbi:phage replication initiation protein, NGO0469 family [Fodinibius sp. AD559]|uniref:phage replication initiation protein, NGO0469 family n=1 Tax=Fodinibius sp. AD559 TaxID=3424179 RepID=UPI004046BEA1
MSLVIKEKQKEYPIPDEGIYNAVAIDCVDLGKIETPWGPKSKISIMFELDSEDEDGNRYIVGKRYTKSLHKKAHLRQDLERWRNKKFKPQELKNSGFDLESLIGVSAIVYISHNETDKRTYANIQSILPPEQGSDGTPQWFITRPSGNYTRVIEREDYQEPEEYADAQNGAG